MEPRGRSLSKPERQRLIASVVSRRRVGSQHELAAALSRAGCEVTQATISRDIRELRLEKTIDALGRPRYVLPGRSRAADTCLVITRSVADARSVARELGKALG